MAVGIKHISTATRRTILAGLAATLGLVPPVAQAQQRDGMRRIGVLIGNPANDPEGQARAGAFGKRLAALGWKEDGNIHIDWRWAGGDPTLLERYAVELVALRPELLVAVGSPTVNALRRQTSSLPIVFTNVFDPVGLGFVASLARPGGTITGFTNYDPPMGGKWLAMLTQITPPAARVAMLGSPLVARSADLMQHAIEDAAKSLTVALELAVVRDETEIEAIMVRLAHEKPSGLIVVPDPFTITHRVAIITLAARYRLPTVYPYKYFATDGGLMSYGIDSNDLFRRLASYVDRILRGDKAADLPVQNPTKFELVINLKTAKALGITVAPSLLATADEVIE